MKLLVVASLMAAVASGARLEHLQRAYLPPHAAQAPFGDNPLGANLGSNLGSNGFGKGPSGNGLTNGNGFGSNGNGHSTNGFGSNGNGHRTNGFGSNGNGHSLNGNGHNTNGNGHSTNGFGSSQGTNGFSNGDRNGFSGATSNQYLPPDQGSSASQAGFGIGGSSIRPACSSCGPSRYSQYKQGTSIPGTSYGVPQFAAGAGAGSSGSGPAFGTSEPSDSDAGTFGSSTGNFGSNSFGSQTSFSSQGANRQYLAPNPSSQNPPQQPFDEKFGYIY
ncbi:uncharacterized protein LOC112050489 [Bicyclus anynana]|uniref:Uncharacterized protein LOC112050489 n=1 Tax=Bicyclus anynana TaxID=110368 RepID=A0A6J1N9W2_BICAN|nr:uncharacterized protein LOC112050489 [Bicyclus anynana]